MSNKLKAAIFGGGCFWCTEAIFKMIKGVGAVEPGYAGNVEVVRVEYDPAQVNYHDLLTIFFGSHDPTSRDRQGADVGEAYRSVIFYTTPEQKEEAEKMIEGINLSSKLGKPIVTEVLPFETYKPAEASHRDYYERNKNLNPYCQIVINPKLEKIQRQFAQFLKNS